MAASVCFLVVLSSADSCCFHASQAAMVWKPMKLLLKQGYLTAQVQQTASQVDILAD